MKKLLIAFGLIISSLHAYSQNGYSSVFLRVTDSATFVNSANTTAKHAANYADIWYSVSSGLFWKWSTVTNTYTMISEGGNFWKNAGTTNVTTPTINGDVTFTGSLVNTVTGNSSGIISGSGNSGVAVDAVAESSRLFASSAGTEIYLSNTGIQASAVGEISLIPTTELHIQTNSVQRLTISNDGSWDLGAGADPGTAGYFLQSNGAGAAPTWVAPSGGTNTSSALTDGGTITITGPKHTLTSTQATITWTLSQTQDFQTTDIILNATSTTWTFPAGALCVVDGVASGTNTAALSGVSGDHHIMSIYKDGTNYRIAIKNFEQ